MQQKLSLIFTFYLSIERKKEKEEKATKNLRREKILFIRNAFLLLLFVKLFQGPPNIGKRLRLSPLHLCSFSVVFLPLTRSMNRARMWLFRCCFWQVNESERQNNKYKSIMVCRHAQKHRWRIVNRRTSLNFSKSRLWNKAPKRVKSITRTRQRSA